MDMEFMVVEVHGVPDTERQDRIADKLMIHFMRRSNNGKDVLTVLYPTPIQGQAYVVFESEFPDVLKCNHVLEVDSKFYPIEVSRAEQSEVDMKVEATLDMRMFKRSEEVSQLLAGFEVTQLSSGCLRLKGSFLNLKFIHAQLTQLLAEDFQTDNKSSTHVNGHSSVPVSQMEPYSLSSRAVPKSTSNHVAGHKMYTDNWSPTIDGAAVGFSNDTKVGLPHSSPPASNRKEVSFTEDTDTITYILTCRQNNVKQIENKYHTEMMVKDEHNGTTTITFLGRYCKKAKEKLLKLINEIQPQLRTQEIYLNQYNRPEKDQIHKRIQLYKDEDVLIKEDKDIVKVVGSSSKSYEVMQKLVGHGNAFSQMAPTLERNSRVRRSQSLPKLFRSGSANQRRNPSPERQARGNQRSRDMSSTGDDTWEDKDHKQYGGMEQPSGEIMKPRKNIKGNLVAIFKGQKKQ